MAKNKTRVENIQIDFEFDSEKYRRVQKEVEQLTNGLYPIDNNDKLQLKYEFCICYWGKIERDLKSLLILLEKAQDSFTSVNSQLIDGASCLLMRVVERLQEVKAAIENHS